ncbi:iron-containing alcohol dehydrogenase [Qiania dongpingensis]|uniref:Iron-containing alcohol dehydrogenase n=1 Tax=Qiania dongpingensis TaxID=2763669 RepID=A0A7G9G4A9_9FIRM|nr:iron-containing alcohol dehydrogenase [Qiania dongpingensis]QNM05641.1 iron-containing alcohol dehydrogenase [Qiania dongpingensis]
MENFDFYAPTKMLFGKGKAVCLPEEMRPFGNRVLMVYGGGSIKKNGIYDTVCGILKDSGFQFWELGGVTPNPKIETVRAGIAMAREHQADMILAVGGGSTVDCGKVIAAGYFYEGDAWDVVKDPSLIAGALPVFTVLTMAATGSEMNPTAVITNQAVHEKQGVHSSHLYPRASVLDPTYLYTLPAIQTAAGVADIMSHIFEGYFKKTEDAYVQDKFSEGILKTCIKWGPVALTEPENYSARANIMWAASMALNGLCGCGKEGKWSCHAIQHQLGAYYDITHGVGLAVITPAWMRYILSENTVGKFVDYAINVWGFPRQPDEFALANMGIDATEQFFVDCGLPVTLSELGIDDSLFEVMAKAAVPYAQLDTQAYVPLHEQDVVNIYRACL